jgi:hypothetical protein
LNFPAIVSALRGSSVRHYFARRFLFLNASYCPPYKANSPQICM